MSEAFPNQTLTSAWLDPRLPPTYLPEEENNSIALRKTKRATKTVVCCRRRMLGTYLILCCMVSSVVLRAHGVGANDYFDSSNGHGYQQPRTGFISERGWRTYEKDLKKQESCISPLDPTAKMSTVYYTLDPVDYGYWAWENDAFKRALQSSIFPDAASYRRYLTGGHDKSSSSSSTQNASGVQHVSPPIVLTLSTKCLRKVAPSSKTSASTPSRAKLRDNEERNRFEDALINM